MTKQKLLPIILSFTLVLTFFQSDVTHARKNLGFTISKKAGTYTNNVQTKVKASAKYKIFFSTTKNFKLSNYIKPGKCKKFSFKKTKTLKLLPIKKNVKLSKSKLKKYSKKAISYRYKIVSSTSNTTASPNTKATTSVPLINTATAKPTNISTPTSSSTPRATSSTVPTIPANKEEWAKDYVEPSAKVFDNTDTDISPEGATTLIIPDTAPSEKRSIMDSSQKVVATISKKNKLEIIEPGTYIIRNNNSTKTVDGLVEVDLSAATDTQTQYIHIILDGINLTSTNNTSPDSDTGIITIKKDNLKKAIITVASGSTNTLSDTGLPGLDKDDNTSITYTGGIFCKKIPLTINGDGILNISSTNGTGIKCSSDLGIINSTINIAKAGHVGISGKTSLATSNANISINSTDDGIKTTVDDDDVANDSSLETKGTVSIDGGNFEITSRKGDALSAYYSLYLNPASMKLVTKNEDSSTSSGSFKCIKVNDNLFIPKSAGKIDADTSETNKGSYVRDGNDSCADDTIHCNGHIVINGGTLTLNAGDDAIHSDKGLQINGGDINVSRSYEGLEANNILINAGTINVISSDDGINCAGGNDSSGLGGFGGWNRPGATQNNSADDYTLTINGGDTTIQANGDGLDSNGSIFINGGITKVFGPTSGGNGIFDKGDTNSCVFEITGGILLGAGTSSMAVYPTSNSKQPYISATVNGNNSSIISIIDSSNTELFNATPTVNYQLLFFSAPCLEKDAKYKINYGSSSIEATAKIYGSSNSFGPGFPF